MVSIEKALGPDLVTPIPENSKKILAGKLFSEDEKERASCIAKGLEGLTIQEAADLLDRFKVYLLQSIFSPEI